MTSIIEMMKEAQEKYNRMMSSGPYFTYEEWSWPLARCVTNQQATANHTAKMANEAKLKSVIANLPEYDPTPYTQWVNKMTRNEAIKIANKCTCDNAGVIGILEALGLIKFDEQRELENVIADSRLFCNTTQEFIGRLEQYGYKIVKK